MPPSPADFGGVRLVGAAQGDGDRLGDIFNAKGRLEVLLNGQWGAVCSQTFDEVDVRAVCRHLGLWYSGSLAAAGSYGYSELPMVATKFGCGITSPSILDCTYSTPGTGCTRDLEVNINCNAGRNTSATSRRRWWPKVCLAWDGFVQWMPCTRLIPLLMTHSKDCVAGVNGLRLVGGTKPNQGRLQASAGSTYSSYYGAYVGTWGSVCGQGFGANEVTVACRTLGYNYGGRLRSISDFGVFPASPLGSPDTLPIKTTNYACDPSAHTALSECPHKSDAVSLADCDHSQDVALECFEGGLGLGLGQGLLSHSLPLAGGAGLLCLNSAKCMPISICMSWALDSPNLSI